jgi:NAD(P)-dependent dehydrogenase (short-subunit alcohol dehydrogenase family)
MSSFKTKISRELAAEYGRQAVQISESGEYLAHSAQVLRIAQMVRRSVDETVSYPPEQPFQKSDLAPAIVADVTDLTACERVVVDTIRCFGHLEVLVNNAGRGMGYVSPQFLTEPTRFWEVDPAGRLSCFRCRTQTHRQAPCRYRVVSGQP